MPDKDSILEIGTTIDTAPIVSGMKEIETSVAESTSKMNEEFTNLAGRQDLLTGQITNLAGSYTELADSGDAVTKQQEEASAALDQSTQSAMDNSASTLQGAAAARELAKAFGQTVSQTDDIRAAFDELARTKMQERFQSLTLQQGELTDRTKKLGEEYDRLKTAGASVEDLAAVEGLLSKSKRESAAVEAQLTDIRLFGVSAVDKEAAAEQMEAIAAGAAARQKQIAAAESAAAAKAEAEANRLRRMEYMQAQMGARMLSSEIGIGMPRAVSRFITQVAPVAGVLAAAFTPIMIIGLIEAIGKGLPKAFNAAYEAILQYMAGVTRSREEMKKHVEEVQGFINEIRRAQIELMKVHVPKIEAMKLDLKVDEAALKTAQRNLRDVRWESNQLGEEMKKYGEYKTFLIEFADASKAVREKTILGGVLGIDYLSGALIASVKKMWSVSTEDATKAAEEVQKQLAAVGVAERKLLEDKLKIYDQAHEEYMTAVRADRDATVSNNSAKLASDKAYFDSRLRMGMVTLEENLSAQRSFADREYEIERDKLANKQRVIDEQKPIKSVNETKAAQTALNAEIFALDQKHTAEITKLHTSSVEARKKKDFELLGNYQAISLGMVDVERAKDEQLVAMHKKSTLEMIADDAARKMRELAERTTTLETKKVRLETEAGLTPEQLAAGMAPDTEEYRSIIQQLTLIGQEGEKARLAATTARFAQEEKLTDANIRAELEATRTSVTSILDARSSALSRSVSLRMTSADDEAAIERDRVRQVYDLQVSEIQEQQRLLARNADATAGEKRALNEKLLALDRSRAEEEAGIEQSRLDRLRTEAEEQISIERDIASQRYGIAKENADRLLGFGTISTARWGTMQREALAEWTNAQLLANSETIAALENANRQGTVDYQRAQLERAAILRDYELQQRAVNDRVLESWRRGTEEMTNAFSSGVHSWIIGQKSFKDAMITSWNNMVMVVINAIEQYVARWIASHLLMAVVHRVFKTQEIAIDTEFMGKKKALELADSNFFFNNLLKKSTQESMMHARSVGQHQLAEASKRMQTAMTNTAERAQVTAKVAYEQAQLGTSVIQHEAAQVVKTTSTVAGEAAQTAATATGSGTRAGIESATATKSVFKSARVAAAKAYQAMADIPIIGPTILGPLAAAVTFAAVMAFGSFQKGGVVSEDMIAQVHKNEMVLPADISASFREMINKGTKFEPISSFAAGGVADTDMFARVHAREMVLSPTISSGLQNMIKANIGGAASGGSGGVNLHYAPTVMGPERWLKKQLSQQADHIGNIVLSQRRKRNM